MSEFLAFFQLGFGHIVTAGAMDHILFLAVLAVVYRARDWREALWVISAFTVGHSVTLALAVSGVLQMSGPVVEFLIPLTIVAAAIENLVMRDRASASRARRYRPLLAAVFGLVHGAGFAGYLQSLFVERIAVPLVGFNVGIEAGQILVLVVIGAALAGVDAVLGRAQRVSLVPRTMPVLRFRIVGLSLMIGLVAAVWAVERRPW
jgi:HupE / UreJ protein